MRSTQRQRNPDDRRPLPAAGTAAQLLVQDLRYGLRMLRKTPGFTIVAVMTLALGIGANTAIFSLLNQVLLQTLPVKNPTELVLLDAPGPNSGSVHGDNAFSYLMYLDIRDQNTVFSGVLGLWGFAASLSYDKSTERVRGELVTGNSFDVLGVRPALGRAFTADDDTSPGSHPLVMLSYTYWQRRFGGDQSILGQMVDINSLPLTVIGVAPPGFFGLEVGNATDIFVPMMMKAAMTPGWDGMTDRRDMWLNIFARLNPAQRSDQAEASLNVLFHQILEGEAQDPQLGSASFRERFVAKHLYLRDGSRGRSSLREHFATPLLVLMGFVAIVLLIVCANIASLLMTRGAARQKEMAIRLALGAGRGRITRQLLVESLLLACIGGGLGIALALLLGSALLRMTPAEPNSLTFSPNPDAGVLFFTFAVSIVTGLVFGLIPALQSSRQAVAQTLRSEATSVAGGRFHARVRKVLVTAQVALSLLLLIGAGLFARSLYNLRSLDTGFKPDHLLEFSIDPSLNGYDDPREITLFSQLQERLKSLPGVKAVSAAELPPVSGSSSRSTIVVEGYEAKEREDMNPNVNYIGPGYFATFGVPLVAGREFTAADIKGAPKVGIINEKARDYWFHGENPLGRRFGFGSRNKPDIEIVGVVRDSREYSLRDEVPRFVYVPYMQDKNIGQATFLIRTSQDPVSLAALVRLEVGNLDSGIPVFNVKTMDTQLDEALYTERMIAMLSVLFGALAGLLAAIGLYGVMSYNVSRRTAEIGIRMALGASRRGALWLVMKEVVWMAGSGVAVALPLAVVLTSYVRSQLYGLAATDALTLILATGLLVGVSLIAGFVPGFRASRINPIQALRYE